MLGRKSKIESRHMHKKGMGGTTVLLPLRTKIVLRRKNKTEKKVTWYTGAKPAFETNATFDHVDESSEKGAFLLMLWSLQYHGPCTSPKFG